MAAALCDKCHKPISFADYDPDRNLVGGVIVCSNCLGTGLPSTAIRVEVPDLCIMGMVIDRSGSMAVSTDGVIEGFNTFISEQKKVPGKAIVHVVQFDYEYEVLYNWTDLNEVALLDHTRYRPRGATALLDAIGSTVISMDAHLQDLKVKPSKIALVVITDGFENHSREFKHEQIVDLLANRKKAGWEVAYLMAMPRKQAYANSAQYGGARGQTMSYSNDSASNREAYRGLSSSMTSFRTGKAKNLVVNTDDEDKK